MAHTTDNQNFCFRFRFRLFVHIEAKRKKEIKLSFPLIDNPVLLRAEKGSIRKADWLVATSCGYPTQVDASMNGERFKRALSVAGAVDGFGADCGFNKPSLWLAKEFRDMIEAQGFELRHSVHGLDVFKQGKTLHAEADVGKITQHSSIERFRGCVGNAMIKVGAMTERQQICASLINDTFFVPNVDVRFILCVTAVEALCDQNDVSQEYQNLVCALSDCLEELEGDQRHKDSLARALKQQKRQSIRSSYKAKIGSLLGSNDVKAFERLYDLRSSLIHDGKGRGELASASNESFKFAARLLQAELESNPE